MQEHERYTLAVSIILRPETAATLPAAQSATAADYFRTPSGARIRDLHQTAKRLDARARFNLEQQFAASFDLTISDDEANARAAASQERSTRATIEAALARAALQEMLPPAAEELATMLDQL